MASREAFVGDDSSSDEEDGGGGGLAGRVHFTDVFWELLTSTTGYPVPQTERVAHEGRPARRDDWNRWTNAFGTDPWSGQHATPKY